MGHGAVRFKQYMLNMVLGCFWRELESWFVDDFTVQYINIYVVVCFFQSSLEVGDFQKKSQNP
jgi:hypothetical protein